MVVLMALTDITSHHMVHNFTRTLQVLDFQPTTVQFHIIFISICVLGLGNSRVSLFTYKMYIVVLVTIAQS